MRKIINNATIVNEGRTYVGTVIIIDNKIDKIIEGTYQPEGDFDEIIEAKGYLLLPGVIDDHVHFRDPGLTHKADMITETTAAVAGGITSFMDMPNCTPQTTTLEALENKFADAAMKCLINHSFYFGATNNNTHLLKELDAKKVCGVKLFMGASTGNMLVDRRESLRKIFSEAPILIATHCEDQNIIRTNTEKFKALYGEDPDIVYHPLIRSEEACFQSTSLAVSLARETGARLHVLHLSTARELSLFEDKPVHEKRITAEACVSHLYFCDEDYRTLGTRIKCNPSIKTATDREALRKALTTQRIDVIATDHAPHLLSEKNGGALKAVSGMPTIQFSLTALLELAVKGVLPLTTVVQKMSHAPADIYQIEKRGFIREGYYADLVLVDPKAKWTVTAADVLSKCGWSPMEGQTFSHKVIKTFVNGNCIFDNGKINNHHKGMALRFNR